MKWQTKPGMAICVAFNQAADGTQLIKRAGQPQRPHFADRLVEFTDPTSTHLATKNVTQRRACQSESNITQCINFDDRDR